MVALFCTLCVCIVPWRCCTWRVNVPVAARLVIMCTQTWNIIPETSTLLITVCFVFSHKACADGPIICLVIFPDQLQAWSCLLTNHRPGHFEHYLVILYCVAIRRHIKAGVRIDSQSHFDSLTNYVVMSRDLEKFEVGIRYRQWCYWHRDQWCRT